MIILFQNQKTTMLIAINKVKMSFSTLELRYFCTIY